MTMYLTAALTPTSDPPGRTITGVVVPWDTPGYTSAGKVAVAKEAITVPTDLRRVKLMRDHTTQQGSTPVGYATAARATDQGLEMTFHIGATDDGDQALRDVTEGIRDGLSVELVDTQVAGGVLTAGHLTAVALVAVPAFSDARISSLTAERTDTVTHPLDTPTTDDTTTPDGEPAPTTPEETTTDTTDQEQDTMPTPPQPPAAAARAPRGVVTAHHRPELTFSQAVDTIARLHTGQASAELTAQLADITRSAHPAISAPAWLGEMWDGREYTREIIPTMTRRALTGLKGIGWQWVKKPEVGDYKGDKAEIPTGTVETMPVEVQAHRMAAGHDIDRAYFDFGETEFLRSFFTARANDYAIKTDEKAAAFIVDSADQGTKVAAEPDLLHAAARARMVIKRQTRVEPSAYLIHPDSMFGLFDITQLDNPAYLDLLGVKPERFIATDLIPAGRIIAYAKQAVTWFELSGSPIRVDAERLDKGGKDSGIFGYYATLLNNSAGIVSVPFGEQPSPAGEEA